MVTWFECKVRYEKIMENGLQKKVTERFLVDALTCTEAEARTISQMTPFISGEFEVSNIKRANYSDVVFSNDANADKWYECKIEFVTLDEKSGKESKTASKMLVQASDLRDAMKRVDDYMKNSMADYNAVNIKETSIMDVYLYTKFKD